MPGEYSFKTAPLGRRLEVDVTPHAVTVRRARGARGDTLELAQVTRARVAAVAARYTTSRWLDLWHPAGRTRLGCNSGGHNDDVAQYEAAVDDILRTLAVEAPEAQILGGAGSRTQWVMFTLGVLALLVGIGLPLAGWLTGVDPKKLLAALAPSVGLGLVGALLLHGNRPWVPEHSFPAHAYLTAAEDDGASPR